MIHVENAEEHLNKIVDALPPYMEKEKILLCCVRDSILNSVVWAYSNRPYDKHNHELWDRLCAVLKECDARFVSKT